MSQINQESVVAIQPELISGESIVWAGQPNTHVIFHRADVYMIPFSLLWGGFAIFWEAGVSGFWGFGQHSGGPWLFGMLWGVPFVLVGQYFIWGRFIYAAWKKKLRISNGVRVARKSANRQSSLLSVRRSRPEGS